MTINCKTNCSSKRVKNQGIDYALSVTGEESLYYGGHSMGCTQYLIMLSAKPEYNEKVCTGCPKKVPNRITCTRVHVILLGTFLGYGFAQSLH